jgi:Hom_end-associated Hint
MPIAHVNSTTVSTAELYNQMANIVSDLMAPTPTGYGFSNSAISTVTNSMEMTLLEWQKLYFEANQIYNHITGHPIQREVGDLPYAGSNQVLLAKHVNLIIDAVNTAVANPHTAAPSQLVPVTIQDFSNPTWDSTIISTVDILWADTIATQYFFNLGGKIQSTLTFDQAFPGPIEDQWIFLITEMQGLMAAHPYTHDLYQLQTPQTFSTTITATGDHITLTYNPVTPYHVTVTVSMIVGTIGAQADSAVDKGLKLAHTCNTYFSAGTLPGPRPVSVTVTTGFHEGGQAIIPVIKTLQVNRTNISYNLHQYDESVKEDITLTNTGNTRIVIAGLIFSKPPGGNGPYPNVYFPPEWQKDDPNLALLVLEPQVSTTLSISYASQYLGVYNNFIHILSDCQNGNGKVAIATRQNVRGPVFRAKLDLPPTADIKSYRVVKLQTTIDTRSSDLFNPTVNGIPIPVSHVELDYYSLGTCKLMWNGQDLSSHPEIFSINGTIKSGPIITYNPEAFVRFSGTTKATLTATVTVNCTSVSVPGAASQHLTTSSVTTVHLDVPPDYHLGDWVSPTSLNNSVVGMSYDLINAQPYLTIGVGLEKNLLDGDGHLAHPLPSQVADANYKLNVNSLGPSADPEWSNGIPLFKVHAPAWEQGNPTTGFLYDYGVWFNADGLTPSGKLLTRRYLINVPASGFYDWKFAADILGYFSINGQILGDTRQSEKESNAQAGYSGTVHLEQGTNIIAIASANVFADLNRITGIALTLRQTGGGSLIWSTLTPVRTRPTYVGWSEVYRIPLVSVGTGVPQTYYSGGYVVKDSGAVYEQYRYQDFFGDYTRGSAGAASLFTIVDDGFGNLSIKTEYKTIEAGLSDADQTLDQLQYVTYYYDTLDFNSPSGQSFDNHARRVHNLDPGPQGDGHQCHQFIGFDADGNVLTRLTRYPGDNGYDPIPRYLVGSLNLGNPSKGPDPKVKSLFSSLATNKTLWALAIAYGLWSGGIAEAVGIGLYLLGASNATVNLIAVQFLGGANFFGFGSAGVGTLFGSTTVLACVSFAAIAIAAYVALEYGGKIWHAITDVLTSVPIIGGVIQGVLDVATGIFKPIGDLIGGVFCCFDPNALVTMADGSRKKIKDIVVGDLVMGRDGQANRVMGIETPVLGDRLMYKFNDHWAFVSEEHKLLTTDGWCVFNPDSYAVERASDEVIGKITVGTEIVTQAGTEIVTVIETESHPYDYVIYNLFVDGDHTYIVEDVVVCTRGDLITSVICEYYGHFPEHCYEMTVMKNFRDQYIIPCRPELIPMLDAYYYASPEIVDRLAEMDDGHSIYLEIKALLDLAVNHLIHGNPQKGADAFVDMMIHAGEATGITIPGYHEYYQLV